MKVNPSSILGFCSGVDRVCKLADQLLEKESKLYCIGELAHNNTVMESYRKRGLVCITDPMAQKPGLAIIGAHGLGDSLRYAYEKAGYTLVDGTCPLIHSSKTLIISNTSQARVCLIAGQKGHAEVEGLTDTWVFEGVKAPCYVLESVKDVEALDTGFSYFLLCQTTFQTSAYEEIKEALLKRFKNALTQCTICKASLNRRAEALRLSKENQAVVVVGSAKSANSMALAKLIESQGSEAFLVENLSNLPSLKHYRSVGLCSGSSASMEQVLSIKEALENE